MQYKRVPHLSERKSVARVKKLIKQGYEIKMVPTEYGIAIYKRKFYHGGILYEPSHIHGAGPLDYAFNLAFDSLIQKAKKKTKGAGLEGYGFWDDFKKGFEQGFTKTLDIGLKILPKILPYII